MWSHHTIFIEGGGIMFKIIWDDLFRSVVDSRLETVLVGWTGVKTFYSHFPDSSMADILDVGLGFHGS